MRESLFFKEIFAVFIFVGILLGYGGSLDVSAQTIQELQAQIETKRLEKEKLDAENKKLEAQIQATQKEANTLQNAVRSLDTTQKKLQNDLKVTEIKIGSTELSIKQISLEIGNKESQIIINREAIAETLRNLHQTSNRSMVETLLQYDTITELWDNVETLRRFQNTVERRITDLKDLKTDLENKKNEDEKQKQQLSSFKTDLSSQKTVVEENKKAKAVLLDQTKNQEAEYKKLLAKNIELGKKFEQELFEFEAKLKIIIDPNSLPSVRSGVIQWPLDNIFITQRFGRTVDSKRLYVSGTHNGVDFRAVTGTPVKSVLSGVVTGVGNTDDQPGCFSYGRWVLIKHNNGLSSLYAHLSSARVSPGQTVTTGDVIGSSGGQPGTPGAGFSTGPHLHLGIYATEGVRIQRYENSNFCKQVSIPIASSNAYLDPLSYLPPL